MYRSILQTKEWATLKTKYGQPAHWVSDVLVLERKLPMGRSFLYLPEIDQVQLHDMDKGVLEELARKCRAVFTRVEIVNQEKEKAPYLDEHFKSYIKAFEDVQPEDRRVIDLRVTEREIFEQMKPKGRYNIRVAARHGVHVADYRAPSAQRVENITHELEFWGRSEDIRTIQEASKKYDVSNTKASPAEVFYKMYQETVTREGISGRSLDYFYDLVDILAAKDMARIFVAYLKDQPLAAAVVTFYEGVASYLYGGSSREHKEVMAPFALHWVIIQEAKKRGCSSYDMLGVAPEGAKENHKWAGITRFKENFGGERVKIIGSYDKVYSPTYYKLYRLAEKMRRRT